MKAAFSPRALPALLLAMTPALALASPLTVGRTSTSQTVIMCPHCGTRIACAKAGDYTIAFAADLDDPQMGLTQLIVSVTDKSGAPVKDARVSVTLSMPEHGHGLKPMTAIAHRNGQYYRSTFQLRMAGVWNAEVAVTTARGDTVKQAFTFRR
jgi:hypothetical protein